MSSSNLNLAPSSPPLNLNTQPSSPGESMTPSTVMNSVTTSLPIRSSSVGLSCPGPGPWRSCCSRPPGCCAAAALVGSGSVCEQDHRAVPTYRNSYHRCREPSNGSNPCRGRIPVDLVRRCLVCRRSNPGLQDTHGENYRRRRSTRPWWLTSHYRHALGSLRRTVLVAVAQRLATRDDSPQTARYHAADTRQTVAGRGTSADLVARRSRRSSRRDPSRQRPSGVLGHRSSARTLEYSPVV